MKICEFCNGEYDSDTHIDDKLACPFCSIEIGLARRLFEKNRTPKQINEQLEKLFLSSPRFEYYVKDAKLHCKPREKKD